MIKERWLTCLLWRRMSVQSACSREQHLYDLWEAHCPFPSESLGNLTPGWIHWTPSTGPLGDTDAESGNRKTRCKKEKWLVFLTLQSPKYCQYTEQTYLWRKQTSHHPSQRQRWYEGVNPSRTDQWAGGSHPTRGCYVLARTTYPASEEHKEIQRSCLEPNFNPQLLHAGICLPWTRTFLLSGWRCCQNVRHRCWGRSEACLVSMWAGECGEESEALQEGAGGLIRTLSEQGQNFN